MTERVDSRFKTRLTATELKAVETQVELEVDQLLGTPPTLESLKAVGYEEEKWLINMLRFIRGAGRASKLVITQILETAAAPIIAILFGLLEFQRVQHGAQALGQSADSAQLVALAVVSANIIHPIYALGTLRGQTSYAVSSPTLRGYLSAFGRRLWGKPTLREVDWQYNPTLHMAAQIITWTTILLAVYDLLEPLITAVVTGHTTKPAVVLVIEFTMGLGLSLAGVLFVQSAAHNLGMVMLSEDPKRLTDLLTEKMNEYDQEKIAIYERVYAANMEAKIADKERQKADKTASEGIEANTFPLSSIGEHKTTFPVNGNNNGR
ncbi:MAG: hypothetical protein LCI00_05575 [Chloroflexi bacterium]|nr:hypothetical protein [Chloroflexota bacterium]